MKKAIVALMFVILSAFVPLEAETSDYFPLDVGNVWVYTPSFGVKGDRVDSIIGTETIEGVHTYIWNRQEAADDNYNEKRWLAKDGTYLSVLRYFGNEGFAGAVVPSQRWAMLKLSPALGDTWTANIDLGNFHVNATYYVESTDDSIDVLAGSFQNCLRIGQSYEITEGGDIDYEYEKVWYAPGVGPVLYGKYSDNWDALTFRQELKSYSVPSAGEGHGNQLAGYTGVNISATNGVLAKIEKSGWTGIALANTTNNTISVTLEALRDAGTTVATEVISLAAHQKRVDLAQNLFAQNIGTATYITYSATAPVVAFQLNGSSDDMMLDALPGLITSGATLYFSHVASDGDWETEICIINTDPVENLSGTLTPYSSTGLAVSGAIPIDIGPKGRRQIVIGEEFSEPDTIGHLVFEGSTEKGVGYLKFYVVGQYRVAVPAAVDSNTGDIYVSHIHSNTNWWTGISLVNTTDSEKQVTIEFDNGETYPLTLEPFEHQAFTIRDIFGGQPQPAIQSAVIRNGSGIVGLELFGSGNLLSGILLKDETSQNLYYPHVASNSTWWTGIVGYNPGDTTASLQVRAYSSDGTLLSTLTEFVGPGEKYIGTAYDLYLPQETGWLHIEADAPITGFELFGLLPEAVDDDGDGYTENQGDCNDGNANIYPGAPEICGDGIDQDCDGVDLTCQDGVVTGSAEGLYEGYTNTGRYVTGLILNDGTFYMLYSIPGSPGIIGGIVQGNSFSSEGIISSNNAKDFNLEGQGVLSATFSGTYLPQQSISGMVSYGNSSYVSFDMFYDSAYELAPNLSKLAGTYLGEVAFPLGYEYAVLTVFPSGTVSGVGSSGCAITGFVAPGTSGNVYSVSVTFGGNPCFFSNQTMSGIAHYDSSSDKLYVALPNATRTSGVLFVGSKQ